VAPMCHPRRAHWHHLANRLNFCFFHPRKSTTQTANRSVLLFLRRRPQSVLYFTVGRPSSSKLPLPMSGSGPPSGTNRVPKFNPNGISIGSAVSAELTSVTDRPTDRATLSATIDRIYVRIMDDAV